MSDKVTMLRETDEALADLHDSPSQEATDSTRIARALWAPGSYWGLRYPSKRTVEGERHVHA